MAESVHEKCEEQQDSPNSDSDTFQLTVKTLDGGNRINDYSCHGFILL